MTPGPLDGQPRPTEPANPAAAPENATPPPTPPPADPAEATPSATQPATAPAGPPPPQPAQVVETTTAPRPGPAPVTESVPAAPRSALERTLPLDPIFSPFSLTVGDGFKFGCGFLMALTIASLIGFLVLSLILLIASLVGAPLPIGR